MMGERDYVLPTNTVRNLNDKLYEKRKAAALEIERMVKEYHAGQAWDKVEGLLRVLAQDFAMSANPHSRKGGLIGLAATAIALGRECHAYTGQLVSPVLACFGDPDSRVRYYACEALYNIVKVARASVLLYFNDVFDSLSKLAADTDQNVKNGSDLLDRLIKDIVSESNKFDLVAFVPLLRERIYTEHPSARRFVVSWIDMLAAVPDIDMLNYLPELLDGLFVILSDPNVEIRRATESVMGEFLKEITEHPDKVDFAAMVNILIQHSQPKQSYSHNELILQFTAVIWLRVFVTLSGRTMLPFASGILTAVLPCVAYEDEKRKAIREAAMQTNAALMALIEEGDDVDPNNLDKAKTAQVSNGESTAPAFDGGGLNLAPMISVFKKYLSNEAMQTRIAILRWIFHLHLKTPHRLFLHVDDLFPVLMDTIKNRSDEVVLLDLQVLAELASSPVADVVASALTPESTPAPDGGDSAVSSRSPHRQQPPPSTRATSSRVNPYFDKFMFNLLSLFSADRQILEDRGAFVIRQLCILMNSEDIYRSLSDILLQEKDTKFAHHMIQTLNGILLTSAELFELRNQLKELKTKEARDLFCCLYRSWCHNPVATVAILLLSQNYKPACQLLQMFGSIEVTVEFLTEIDKLVQLIESPIFTFLRLQLLDPNHNFYLIRALYGILMLLPQTDAFFTLQRRLECVPTAQMQMQMTAKDHPSAAGSPFVTSSTSAEARDVDFDALLAHFQAVQDKHLVAKKEQKRGQLERLMQQQQ